MNIKKLWHISVLLLFANVANAQKPGGNLFNGDTLHEIRITFAEQDFWEILKNNYGGQETWSVKKKAAYLNAEIVGGSSEDDIPYLKGNITIDGFLLNNIGVRLKGYSSYFSVAGYKKSLKIDFNAFEDLDFYGLKKINLNNGVGDPSLQRDAIAYNLLAKAGIAVPRTAYAKVYINDKYWGLYLLVEQIDKTFLEHNFANGKGNLYKNMGWSSLDYLGDNFSYYKDNIELKTNKDKADGSDFVHFVKNINTNTNFKDSIQKVFYVNYYLKILAIDVILKNWDSYIQHGRNFYLYHEPVSDLFYWIPWDYNLSMNGSFMGGGKQEGVDTCPKLDFTFDTIGTTVNFYVDTSVSKYDYYYWDFADWQFENRRKAARLKTAFILGETDTIKNSYPQLEANEVHEFSKRGIFPVTLYGSNNNGCYKSITKKVILIDTAGLCKSVMNRNTAYFPSPENDSVFKADTFCCNCSWDGNCESIYTNLLSNSQSDDSSYPIDYSTSQIMIRKLLEVSEFKKSYYDQFKFILDSLYIPDSIIAFINKNADLIREAVYADTNHLYTPEIFEMDLNAICNSNGNVTSLSRFSNKRKTGLLKEFNTLGHTPKPVEQTFKFSDVAINEVCASIQLNDGEDWIELYNNTENIVSLKNIFLSDNENTLEKWQFPDNTAIKPNGFIIVWADKETLKKNNLHANFKLSADGESLFVFSKNSGMVDSISFGLQAPYKTFSRIPDGTGEFVVRNATHNKSNSFVTKLDNLIDKESFTVFPNPASKWAFVKLPSNESFKLSITDLTGRQMLQTNLTGPISQIDLQGFNDGVYFLVIHNKSNNISNKIKLLIKN